MSSLNIKVIEGPGDEVIEDLVSREPYSLIYSNPAYINVIAQHTQSTPYWLVAKDVSGLQAALPLLVKKGALGSVVNSLAFFGSHGGAIVPSRNFEAWLSVVRAFESFGDEIGAISSTLITNPFFGDCGLYKTHHAHDLRDVRIGQFTDFPNDNKVSSLLALFDDPRPRNIRKARRSGVKITRSQSVDDLTFLHATHEKNIQSIGGIHKELSFFLKMAEELPHDAWAIYLAERDNEKIAALLLLYGYHTV